VCIGVDCELQGFDLVPLTLEVGDYVLSPTMVVERKAVPDLLQSLARGRWEVAFGMGGGLCVCERARVIVSVCVSVHVCVCVCMYVCPCACMIVCVHVTVRASMSLVMYLWR
jgi:hypothetical protein